MWSLGRHGRALCGVSDARELARWLRIVSANRLINLGPDWKNTGQGGSNFGGSEFCTDATVLGDAVDAVSDVDWPREVARCVYVYAQSWKGLGAHFAEQDPSRGAGVHQHERVQSLELAKRCETVPTFGPHSVEPGYNGPYGTPHMQPVQPPIHPRQEAQPTQSVLFPGPPATVT